MLTKRCTWAYTGVARHDASVRVTLANGLVQSQRWDAITKWASEERTLTQHGNSAKKVRLTRSPVPY